MYCRFIVLTFAFFPCFSTASSFCEAPKFEELVRAGTSVTPDPGGLAITMQPIAEVRIPSDFSKIGSLPNGSIGFGGHPKGISAVLGYETSESLSVPHRGGSQPRSFFRFSKRKTPSVASICMAINLSCRTIGCMQCFLAQGSCLPSAKKIATSSI